MTDFYLDPYSLDPYTSKTPFDMFNTQLAGKKTPLEVMEIGVTELLNRYNKAGYKYDAVMALYAHDFVEPTNVLNLEKAVKLWNSKHRRSAVEDRDAARIPRNTLNRSTPRKFQLTEVNGPASGAKRKRSRRGSPPSPATPTTTLPRPNRFGVRSR